jgi:hypothetical protein
MRNSMIVSQSRVLAQNIPSGQLLAHVICPKNKFLFGDLAIEHHHGTETDRLSFTAEKSGTLVSTMSLG